MSILGQGIDIVDIARIERMLREHGSHFIERCFTDAERDYAESGGPGGRRMEGRGIADRGLGGRRAEARYAVRFAAKEAVFKALGTGWRSGISWRDVGVSHEASGRPALVISGRCAEIARQTGIVQWHVSLSHGGDYAIASVIACGKPDRK